MKTYQKESTTPLNSICRSGRG